MHENVITALLERGHYPYILKEVFQWLSLRDLCRCSTVCKNWRWFLQSHVWNQRALLKSWMNNEPFQVSTSIEKPRSVVCDQDYIYCAFTNRIGVYCRSDLSRKTWLTLENSIFEVAVSKSYVVVAYRLTTPEATPIPYRENVKYGIWKKIGGRFERIQLQNDRLFLLSDLTVADDKVIVGLEHGRQRLVGVGIDGTVLAEVWSREVDSTCVWTAQKDRVFSAEHVEDRVRLRLWKGSNGEELREKWLPFDKNVELKSLILVRSPLDQHHFGILLLVDREHIWENQNNNIWVHHKRVRPNFAIADLDSDEDHRELSTDTEVPTDSLQLWSNSSVLVLTPGNQDKTNEDSRSFGYIWDLSKLLREYYGCSTKVIASRMVDVGANTRVRAVATDSMIFTSGMGLGAEVNQNKCFTLSKLNFWRVS